MYIRYIQVHLMPYTQMEILWLYDTEVNKNITYKSNGKYVTNKFSSLSNQQVDDELPYDVDETVDDIEKFLCGCKHCKMERAKHNIKDLRFKTKKKKASVARHTEGGREMGKGNKNT